MFTFDGLFGIEVEVYDMPNFDLNVAGSNYHITFYKKNIIGSYFTVKLSLSLPKSINWYLVRSFERVCGCTLLYAVITLKLLYRKLLLQVAFNPEELNEESAEVQPPKDAEQRV